MTIPLRYLRSILGSLKALSSVLHSSCFILKTRLRIHKSVVNIYGDETTVYGDSCKYSDDFSGYLYCDFIFTAQRGKERFVSFKTKLVTFHQHRTDTKFALILLNCQTCGETTWTSIWSKSQPRPQIKLFCTVLTDRVKSNYTD